MASPSWWTPARYGNSPIIALGAAGTWKETDLANPDVKWDAANSRWVMNLSGYSATNARWCTGFAYSTDLVTWVEDGGNPYVLPGGGDGGLKANGSHAYFGGNWYLVLQVIRATAARLVLMKGATLTGLTDQNGGNPILNLGAGGSWDERQHFDPYLRVSPDGTKLELWFGGDNFTAQRAIGYASSTDGSTWTKQSAPYLTLPASTPLNVNNNFGEPCVLTDGPTTYVTYDTAASSGHRHIGLGMYDGKVWTFIHDWIAPGSDAWENTQRFDSNMVLANGQLYLFSAGASAAGVDQNVSAQIGLINVPYYRGAI